MHTKTPTKRNEKMTNDEFIMLTEDNATPELVVEAFNSTMGLHYDTHSKKVRAMVKECIDAILAEKRLQK